MDDQRKSLHFAIMQLQAGIPVEKWAKSVLNARDQEPSGQLRVSPFALPVNNL